VLAPTVVQQVEAWDQVVTALVTRPDLGGVRWIVVDLDHDTADGLAGELGTRAMSSTCKIDDDALLRDLETHVALLEAAPAGAPGPACVGAAWPKGVLPPTRGKGEPMPAVEVARELEAAGLSPALAGDVGPKLKLHIMRGALALRRGDAARAVDEQRAASKLCAAAGLVDAALLLRMTIAGYLMHAGAPRLARDEFAAVASTAKAGRNWSLAAQALLGLGALLALERRPGEAATAYREAAQLAELAGITVLAIEAWRMTGQLALDHGSEADANTAWRRAIALADSDLPVSALSSAPQTARALAAVCRRRGRIAEAQALEAQSLQFEQPAIATPPS
jgi:tetratricopeptide (TPR) repeat protein